MLLTIRGFVYLCLLQRRPSYLIDVGVTSFQVGTNSCRRQTKWFVSSIDTTKISSYYSSTSTFGLHRSQYKNKQAKTSTMQSSTREKDAESLASMNAVGQQDIGRENIEQQQSLNAASTTNVDEEGTFSEDTLYMDSPINNKLSWRQYLEISIARTRKIRGSNYIQIATVDTITNEPRCRTVVFRGFLQLTALSNSSSPCLANASVSIPSSNLIDPNTNKTLSCIMKMCTDARSEKVHQTGPTEIVWWFPKTSEQYRIRGTMILIGNDTSSDNSSTSSVDQELLIARKEMWGSLTDASRESFITKERPGDLYVVEDSGHKDRIKGTDGVSYGGRDNDGKIIQPPPETFLLMLVVPNRCDYLNLSNMYRQIDRVCVDTNNWQSQRVNA